MKANFGSFLEERRKESDLEKFLTFLGKLNYKEMGGVFRILEVIEFTDELDENGKPLLRPFDQILGDAIDKFVMLPARRRKTLLKLMANAKE